MSLDREAGVIGHPNSSHDERGIVCELQLHAVMLSGGRDAVLSVWPDAHRRMMLAKIDALKAPTIFQTSGHQQNPPEWFRRASIVRTAVPILTVLMSGEPDGCIQVVDQVDPGSIHPIMLKESADIAPLKSPKIKRCPDAIEGVAIRGRSLLRFLSRSSEQRGDHAGIVSRLPSEKDIAPALFNPVLYKRHETCEGRWVLQAEAF